MANLITCYATCPAGLLCSVNTRLIYGECTVCEKVDKLIIVTEQLIGGPADETISYIYDGFKKTYVALDSFHSTEKAERYAAPGDEICIGYFQWTQWKQRLKLFGGFEKDSIPPSCFRHGISTFKATYLCADCFKNIDNVLVEGLSVKIKRGKQHGKRPKITDFISPLG